MLIFVETNYDLLISIEVHPEETVKDVKVKIQDKIGISPESLIFSDTYLDDEKRFFQYNIPEFSKIYCFSKKLSNLYAEIVSVVQIDHNYSCPVSSDVDDIEFPECRNAALLDHTYCLVEYVKEEIFENADASITLQPLVLKTNYLSEVQEETSFSTESRNETLASESDKEAIHLSCKPICTCASETDGLYSERKPLPTDSLVPEIDWATIKIPEIATQALTEQQIGVLEEPTENDGLKNVPHAEIHASKTVEIIEITPQPDEEYRRKLFEHLFNSLRILILEFEKLTYIVDMLQETDDVKELKEHLTIMDSTIEMHSPVIRYYNIEGEALHSLLIFAEEMLKMSRRLRGLRRVMVNMPPEFDIVLKRYQTANKELELSFLNISEYFPCYFDEMESYILLTAESEEITTQTTPGPNVAREQETVPEKPVQDPVQVEQSDDHQALDSKNKTSQTTNQKGAGLTRRQMHKMKTSKYLVDCLPKCLIPNYLHVIDFKVTEINAVAADYPSFGILSSRLLPKINDFIISSSTGNFHVNLHQPKSGLFLTKKQIDDAERLHRVLFQEVVKITSAFIFNPANSNMAFYIVPVLNNNIYWKFFDHHSQQPPQLKVKNLPAAIYRIHCLLLAEELRFRISTEMSPTAQQELLAWPVLDLSKTDALNPTHVPRLPCEDITTNESEILSFCREVDFRSNPGPDPGLVLQALTLVKAKDQINHERLEVIGDSFLEYAIILKLLVEFPEAQITQIFKSKKHLVKNLTLFNLAQLKGLSAYLVAKPFVESNWIPPCYASHSPNSVSEVALCDKCIADTVQALIGTYLLAWGQRGALLYMQWIGLDPLPNKHTQTPTNADFSQWPNYAPHLTIGSETPATEEELHLIKNIQTPYTFTNKDILAKLLLSKTYIREYQRMVCLGTTVLNYVITRLIFHQQTDLTPGEMSSLRAEITRKKSLALIAVNFNFQHMIFVKAARERIKSLKESSLFEFFKEHGHISSELESPVGESTYRMLADLFRGFAGAVFVDSGNNIDIVWQCYFPMLKPTLVHCQKEMPVDLTARVQQLLRKSNPISQIFQTEDGLWHCQILLPNGILIDEKGRSKKIAKNLAYIGAFRELEKKSN